MSHDSKTPTKKELLDRFDATKHDFPFRDPDLDGKWFEKAYERWSELLELLAK